MKELTTGKEAQLIIGVDLGDRLSEVCVMDASGEVRARTKLKTTAAGFEKFFRPMVPARIALEVGTHSPWVSRLLKSWGHEVLVANARKVRLIYQSTSKSDRMDAEALARLARLDPKLLSPISHRSGERQRHLALLRARDALVRARSLLVNHVRGAVKAMGGRLPACSTAAFGTKAELHLPETMKMALEPLLKVVETLTEQIEEAERGIGQVARKHYPEVVVVTQPTGVGLLTGLRFVLTLEEPRRFRRNRSVGAYLGLTPRRSQSGDQDRQMRITKAGDSDLRRSLMQCSHYILGPFGPDSDLRRFGMKLAERGGKSAKKRALVAVARRLAVLMLSLWKTGEVYEPLRQTQLVAQVPA